MAPGGFARFTASTKALMFSASLSSPNEALPTEPCTMPGLLGAELDGAALRGADRRLDVHRHRADLRVRHQTAGTQNLAETADERHHVRSGDAAVEVDLAALDGGHEVLGPDHVGAGIARFVRLGAAGEDRDAQGAAGAVRQVDDAAHHLVGVLRVDAEVEATARPSRRT